MRDSEREPFYDDKTPSTGCGSECVSKCTSVYTTWHLDTCRHSANLCPAFLVAVTYAQLVVVNWTSPVSICPRTRDRRLPTPVLHPGTRCPTISRTLIFPFNLSNVILRHSSFPHELAHLSAFEISYKNALYKFTVIIIVIIIFLPRYSVPEDLEITNKEKKNYNGCNRLAGSERVLKWDRVPPLQCYGHLLEQEGSLSRRLWCLLSVFRSPWPVWRLDGARFRPFRWPLGIIIIIIIIISHT